MKPVTRRNFIRTGAAAALGISAVPAAAFAADVDAQPVKVGVVGMGNRGTSHVNCLLTI